MFSETDSAYLSTMKNNTIWFKKHWFRWSNNGEKKKPCTCREHSIPDWQMSYLEWKKRNRNKWGWWKTIRILGIVKTEIEKETVAETDANLLVYWEPAISQKLVPAILISSDDMIVPSVSHCHRIIDSSK